MTDPYKIVTQGSLTLSLVKVKYLTEDRRHADYKNQ
jgi:hypothetical protein